MRFEKKIKIDKEYQNSEISLKFGSDGRMYNLTLNHSDDIIGSAIPYYDENSNITVKIELYSTTNYHIISELSDILPLGERIDNKFIINRFTLVPKINNK